MISQVQGVLDRLEDGAADVRCDSGLTYRVLVPAFLAPRLATETGKPVRLHTIYSLEGSSQGNSFTPQLAGFLEPAQRAFFELFTTVKGIGSRKALKAMTVAPEQIAAAICDRDIKTLQTLPGVGRRAAETIVATLHGKVDQHVSNAAYAGTSDASGQAPAAAPAGSAARETLEVLLQLGESRSQAMNWIDEVLTRQPEVDDSGALLENVLRLKAGA
ncbi:MAG: helix-hairpin-helix domain-containing protein [Phycisphaerae bacterium]|nr:helix-hairpin-helix domain-containing protein [Phycisphaerae bacterium]